MPMTCIKIGQKRKIEKEKKKQTTHTLLLNLWERKVTPILSLYTSLNLQGSSPRHTRKVKTDLSIRFKEGKG